jgi:hypothetical protein
MSTRRDSITVSLYHFCGLSIYHFITVWPINLILCSFIALLLCHCVILPLYSLPLRHSITSSLYHCFTLLTVSLYHFITGSRVATHLSAVINQMGTGVNVYICLATSSAENPSSGERRPAHPISPGTVTTKLPHRCAFRMT